MKNIISLVVIVVALLFVPLVIFLVSHKNNSSEPSVVSQSSENVQIDTVSPILDPANSPAAPPAPATPPPMPSSRFMKGYWDGWHGSWVGPIRWIFSDDYRQGHMLGRHDRIHNIQRYTPGQR